MPKFPNINKVGAHISQDKARIDFAWDGSISPVLIDIQKTQAIIDSNQPIISAFSDESAERRYWKINEFFHLCLVVVRTLKRLEK